jgi:DNA polymerase-3 subunit alpha
MPNTTAVFQFESVGMKKMLKEARPSKFEEIIAFVSFTVRVQWI